MEKCIETCIVCHRGCTDVRLLPATEIAAVIRGQTFTPPLASDGQKAAAGQAWCDETPYITTQVTSVKGMLGAARPHAYPLACQSEWRRAENLCEEITFVRSRGRIFDI